MLNAWYVVLGQRPVPEVECEESFGQRFPMAGVPGDARVLLIGHIPAGYGRGGGNRDHLRDTNRHLNNRAHSNINHGADLDGHQSAHGHEHCHSHRDECSEHSDGNGDRHAHQHRHYYSH